jgi:tRNA threonylcarbamoyladenosine biosynthesis protein TsaB
MHEIYWGCYRRDGEQLQLLGAEGVGPAAGLLLPDGVDLARGRWLGSGSGWQFAAQMPSPLVQGVTILDTERQPSAGAMARLAAFALARGEGLAPELAQPLYLRDNVALKKGEQR